MAIMAPAIQIVKRADGRSSVAFAAYRAAAMLYDERTGTRFDYTRKSGIVHTEILAPDHAPDWVYDRQQLWARVELASNRKDAQVAREFMLPLPHELAPEERLELVRAFVRDEFVAKGMIADIAIHLPDRQSDQRNHHAHVTCTMRHITPEGFGKQAREWNDDFAGMKKLFALRKAGKEEEALAFERELRATRPIFDWREKWAASINRALQRAGHAARVDHRSWIEQGIDRQAETHVGVEATQLERRGEETRLGNERRKAQDHNGQTEQNVQEAEILSLALERKKRQAREDHLAATALDRTRMALRELGEFDQGHAEINNLDRQISGAIAEARRLEHRQVYARRLLTQVKIDFENVYDDRAEKAHGQFWKDVARHDIHWAVRELRHNPARYGPLPGWQIGKRLFLSKERRQARGTLARAAECARQGHFMQAKIQAKEEPRRKQLAEHIVRLREQKTRLLECPPEGRLLIQRGLYETARHLRREDWQALSPSERFHVTQARQLMKHRDLRDWADERVSKLIADSLSPAPAPDFRLLSEPIDLVKVAPGYRREQLDKLWEQIKARQEDERKALAAAEKAAAEGQRVRHVNLTQKGFVGLLARTTGLHHLFEAVYARHARKLEEQYATLRRALNARHEREVGAVRTEYASLRERVLARLKALREHGDPAQARRLEADLARERERAAREEANLAAEKKQRDQSNARDVTEQKSRGWRRSEARDRKRRPDQGYGYRRSSKKTPRRPKDDDTQ